ncbi:MAG: tetratricopeptide repeat protein [Elusimicrobiota bacterium]|nr:tetratricopeptide repeat protein [Elusimicrobiota bacterium]
MTRDEDPVPRGQALARALTAACVLTLFAVAAGQRTLDSFATLSPNPADDTAVFWSESAFHYRYARMAAQGEAFPGRDVRAQHPEGVEPRREYTLLMERAAGASYRAVRNLVPVPFHIFIIFFTAFVSSLAVPAFFVAARAVSASRLLALLATGIYAMNPASWSRFIGTFVYEGFALPWLLLGAAGILASLDEKRDARSRRLAAAAAAACLIVALASWHFSRFVLLVFIAAIAARCAARWGDRAQRRSAMETLAIIGAACLAAGLAMGRRLDPEAYAHVGALLTAKLSHLLVKPADPSRLPEAARLLWLPPLESLSAADALYAVLPLAPMLLIPFMDRNRKPVDPFLRTCAAAFGLGAMMVSRLLGLAVIFASLEALSRLEGMRRRGLAAAALAASLALAHAGLYAPAERAKPFGDPVRRRAMLGWIRSHTEPGDAFASNFAVASSILAYADRPVLLNPKFETAATRRKAAKFLRALAGTDEELLAYCREYDARYLLYESVFALDDSPQSMRYAANALTLSTASAAFRLHFEPAAFRGLRLVYEDGDYRIFRVLRPDDVEGAQGFRPRRDPIYDLREFASGRRDLVPGDAGALVARLARRRALVAAAFELDRAGEPGRAEEPLRAVLKDFPYDAETLTDLGILRSRAGDARGTLEALERAVGADPNDLRAHSLLAESHLAAGRNEAAARVMNRVRELDPR